MNLALALASAALLSILGAASACSDGVTRNETSSSGASTGARGGAGGAGGAASASGSGAHGGVGDIASSASTGAAGGCDGGSNGCSDCQLCGATNRCVSQANACFASDECIALNDCDHACGDNNPPCSQDCLSLWPDAAELFLALDGCLGSLCTMSCGAGGG